MRLNWRFYRFFCPLSWESSISNQLLNEDGTVSTAIELEEGDQVKVWGYASQYLELQEGLKIVVVQPGIIERNGEQVILDKNLKVD